MGGVLLGTEGGCGRPRRAELDGRSVTQPASERHPGGLPATVAACRDARAARAVSASLIIAVTAASVVPGGVV